MLKLTYTEDSVNLELLEDSLNNWLYARLILSVSASIPINFEPTIASFNIPKDSEITEEIEAMVELENNLEIDGHLSDSVEIIIKGIWIVSPPQQQEGIFVTSLSTRTEMLLFRGWVATLATETISI